MSLLKKILLVVSVFTISFDLFLTIEIGSATLRLSNIAIFVLGIIVFFEKCLKGKLSFKFLKYPMVPMIYLVVVCFLSILNSEFFQKSIAYSFFALFNFIFYVWLIIELVKNEKDLRFLIKIYLLSFLFVAIFGFIQFFLPLASVDAPLAKAFLVDGIPRVNAFSYEPAQFTTYMLPGLVIFLFFFLFSGKINIINRFWIKIGSILLPSIIILSTARTGWIGLALIFIVLFFSGLRFFLKRWKINKPILKLIILSVVLVVLILPIVYFFYDQFIFFFEGMFNGQASAYRWQGVLYSLKVFWENPILGVGIGGLGAYMIDKPSEFDLSKIAMDSGNVWNVSGTNVATEILATLGILGFLVWLWLLYRFLKYVWQRKNNYMVPYEWRMILGGLFWGFVVQIIVLQFNQNFFRNYVWLHMGITLAVCYFINQKYLKKAKDYEKN